MEVFLTDFNPEEKLKEKYLACSYRLRSLFVLLNVSPFRDVNIVGPFFEVT